MLKQNVYILNFDELYEIFDEVKNVLNFNVCKVSNLDLQKLNKENNLNLKDSIIITSFNKKNCKISTLDKKEFIILENLPIFLPNLIEKINIFFLKIKFNSQNKIYIKNYNINLNNRTIYNDDVETSLTEKEIQIIVFLLEKKTPQKISMLQNQIWHFSNDLETHTVETHIYRLRKKIKTIFGDDRFILSGENGYYF
tara:strand:+ start:389 stop:979 length:591 start_codon:yes stop_codon:yes gene_type:complete